MIGFYINSYLHTHDVTFLHTQIIFEVDPCNFDCQIAKTQKYIEGYPFRGENDLIPTFDICIFDCRTANQLCLVRHG